MDGQPISESRKATKERLIAEGRWEQFKTARELMKLQGKNPAESHALTLEDFQPLDGKKAKARGRSDRRPHRRTRIDWRQNLEWVYRNLNQTAPKGYPNGGARMMHEWARENKDEFFRAVLRLVPTRSKEEKEDDEDTDGQAGLDLIAKFMKDNNIPEVAPTGGQHGGSDAAGGS